MSFEIFGCEVYISVPFTAFIAVMFLFDRTGMMTVSLAGAAVHETGHILAMRLLGVMPKRIELRPAVVNIVRPPKAVSFADDIKISLAGPAAGIIAAALSAALYLIFGGKVWLNFAAVSASLSFFNMLPVSELDGGQVLNAVLMLKFPADAAAKVTLAVSCFFTALMLAAGALLFCTGYGNATILITGIYLLILTLLKLKS